VFIVHSGQWAFRWGDQCQDGEAVLGPGDCISIPVNVFRGFENVGEGIGYLFAVLGGDDPGNVLWAPDVFDKASEYGLVLLENGRLVDTTKGESAPEGIAPMPATTAAQVAAHRVMSLDEMLDCVYLQSEQSSINGSLLTDDLEGVSEHPMIGPANPAEGTLAGKISNEHGFHVRRLDMNAGASMPLHSREEEEVLYLHSGRVILEWEQGELAMVPGDVLTVPKGMMHGYRAESGAPVIAYVVRGGNAPQGAAWLHQDTAQAAGNQA
jgi:mannose-6-phosphate isomerase-like protein (cupin superfamily)